MAVGVYGNTRGADVDVSDISVYYNYTPNRETFNNTMYKLESTDVLSSCTLPSTDELYNVGDYTENVLEGLYNLALPSSVFNQTGIYTVYLKPKTLPIQIKDCSVLSSLPSVRGILINKNDLPEKLKSNNALQGFRVEYINASDGTKMRNVVRHVVTSNLVEPINENIGNSGQSSTRYRFNDSGSLLFLQLTPSSSSDVKSNILPYMGNIGQTVLLSNTYFSPLTLEIEMVENTIDTLTNAILGNEIKDIQSGILTKLNTSGEIISQHNIFEIKSDIGDVPLYEVREKRTQIDSSQNFNNVLGDV